jgi:putative pyoverdin transport system ATP-binding/permease protein
MNLMRFLITSSRGIVMLSAIAGAAGGIASIALIVLIQSELGRETSSSSAVVWAFGALCVVSASARIIGQVGMVKLGQGAVAELSLHMVRRTLDLSLREFERIDTSSLLAALTEDIVLIANAMVGIPQLCINIPIVIACLAYIGWLSPVIFVCGVIFAALAIAAYLGLSARAIKDLREARACQDVLVGHYRTLIDGFRELKLHRGRRAAYLAESLEPTMVSARGQMVRGLSSFAFAEGWSQLAFFGFIGVLLFAIPCLEPISQPTRVAAVLVVLYLMAPLDIILTWLPVLGRARASLSKVQALIPALERRGDEADDRRFPARGLALCDSVSLEGVTFTHRDGHDDAGFTLGPVDLTLRPGEIVILAGGNGSGKTTLVKLISGLYKSDSGSVRLDGRVLEDQDREAYRQLFSVVFADGHLFPDFLGLGTDGIESRARDGLERLGLARQVSVRGNSFSTVNLSQGQRRRLALLGAWLEDRPISIFDEWAANQDLHFKHVFYHTLLPELRAAGKALLVISHDENHFDIADRVIRLQDGRLLEEAPLAIGDSWPRGTREGMER